MATCFHFKGKTTPLSCMKSNKSPQKGPHKHISIKVSQNHSYWASIESDIEANLKKAIPIGLSEFVMKPMNVLIFTAPQTRASALCVAACELVGGDRSQALAAASAIRVMHVAAHTHENLLLIEEPKSRPRPESDFFGHNIKLLMGDAIAPFGLELMAKSMDQAKIDPDRILRVIMEITRDVGSQGVVEGQNHEFVLDSLNISSNDWDVNEYIYKKKGELHACGAACGAILGGGAEEEIEKLRKYGLLLGMIYGMLAKDKPGMEEKIQKLKSLAVKELESFTGKNTELVSSLAELSSGGVRIQKSEST